MESNTNRRLLSVKQAGEYLGLSPKTLYAWIEAGRVPYVALGRRRMLDTHELDKFIRQNTVTPRGN
jgi:excisionase family DNA binding protein